MLEVAAARCTGLPNVSFRRTSGRDLAFFPPASFDLVTAIDVFPYEPLDPGHPIRTASYAVLSPHRAGLVREALWEIGRLVVDDLDAIVNGLPPRRLQAAEPEFASRYVRTTQIPTESR